MVGKPVLRRARPPRWHRSLQKGLGERESKGSPGLFSCIRGGGQREGYSPGIRAQTEGKRPGGMEGEKGPGEKRQSSLVKIKKMGRKTMADLDALRKKEI